jgi:hypothetical protein
MCNFIVKTLDSLWDGRLARPEWAGEDAHPTISQRVYLPLRYRTSTLMYLPAAKGAGIMGVNLARSLASFRT